MKLIDYVLSLDEVTDERAARGLIMRGDVLVDERPVTSVAAEVAGDSVVRLKSQPAAQVSRGQLKLGPAIACCGFDVRDKVAADLGASAGGFTRVLLERGATRVYAVDVGYGILDLKLRADERVTVLERTNARKLTVAEIPEKLDRVVGDLSFISWRAVLPAVVPLIQRGAELLLLIKPQFELAAAGRGSELEGGVAKDPDLIHEALTDLGSLWIDNSLVPLALMPSSVRGAKGNQEYFIHLVDNEEAAVRVESDYREMINVAVKDFRQ